MAAGKHFMGTNLSQEIVNSLKVLGLEPGASTADVRAAFRRLAHALHPDVAGQEEAGRFQRITGAYALLKGLTPEELERFTTTTTAPEEGPQGEEPEQPPRPRNLFEWYRKRAGRLDETEEARREAKRRGVRVDAVLERCDQRLSRHLERLERDRSEVRADAVLSRLKSSVPGVRRLALGRVGPLTDREDVMDALAALLNRQEVDEETARLVAGLPMDDDTRRRLAGEVAGHAGVFPNSLLASLLGLRQPGETPDLPLMERYLPSVSPAGVALILRHWPADPPPADVTLRRLLASDDPQVLIPVLSAMKQRFPASARQHRRRLAELQSHPAPAVRVWGRVLTPPSGPCTSAS